MKKARRLPKTLDATLYCYVEKSNEKYAKDQGKQKYGSHSAYINTLICKDRGTKPPELERKNAAPKKPAKAKAQKASARKKSKPRARKQKRKAAKSRVARSSKKSSFRSPSVKRKFKALPSTASRKKKLTPRGRFTVRPKLKSQIFKKIAKQRVLKAQPITNTRKTANRLRSISR